MSGKPPVTEWRYEVATTDTLATCMICVKRIYTGDEIIIETLQSGTEVVTHERCMPHEK